MKDFVSSKFRNSFCENKHELSFRKGGPPFVVSKLIHVIKIINFVVCVRN